jgi:hypothetical protein
MAMALALVGASACYKPKITNGGVACNKIFDQECPSGYSCLSDGRCWQDGTTPDADVEQMTDEKVEAPVDVTPPDAAPEAKPDAPIVCLVAPSNCTPAGGPGCDPMCQTGCPRCDQKCSVSSKDMPTCNFPSGPLIRQVGESCTPVSQGTPAQTDNCAPGLVCIMAACGGTCFKFCRVDADCPSSECSRTIPGGVTKICDVPAVTCNPVTMLGATGCPFPAQGCYVSATIPDETRCDCPFDSVREGGDCTVSRQCVPGLVCADPGGAGHFVCARACKLGVPAGMSNGCLAPTTCNTIKMSKTFGFCR